MPKIPLFLIALIFTTLTIKGQNLFFIGENSYPSTETITLRSNSEDGDDLDILLAKDGKKGLFAVDTRSYTGVKFGSNIIIYLDDGTVITCIDRGKSDHVDDRAKAVYNLTSDELNKMKNSNIHTVRYTLKCSPCKGFFSTEEGNWSALCKLYYSYVGE